MDLVKIKEYMQFLELPEEFGPRGCGSVFVCSETTKIFKIPVSQPIHFSGPLFFPLSLFLTALLVPDAQISACVGWGCLSPFHR